MKKLLILGIVLVLLLPIVYGQASSTPTHDEPVSETEGVTTQPTKSSTSLAEELEKSDDPTLRKLGEFLKSERTEPASPQEQYGPEGAKPSTSLAEELEKSDEPELRRLGEFLKSERTKPASPQEQYGPEKTMKLGRATEPSEEGTDITNIIPMILGIAGIVGVTAFIAVKIK